MFNIHTHIMFCCVYMFVHVYACVFVYIKSLFVILASNKY